MHEELRPELQSAVDLRHRLRVVCAQLDALPEFGRGVRALDRLHAQVQDDFAGFGGRGGADGGVAGVGERAGLPVAEAGDVVGVAAEGLVFGGFQLEGAELLIDDLPDDFVGGHCG